MERMGPKQLITIFIFLLIAFLGLLSNLLYVEKLPEVKAISAPVQKEVGGLNTLPVTTEKEDPIQEFSLRIPLISLEHDVIRNVSPSVAGIYAPIIEKNIAHGKYTLLPNQAVDQGNVYLFAHRRGMIGDKSIGYFARLDELKKGDIAIINFDGSEYRYALRGKKVVSATDTSVYTAYSATPILTLQTCENGSADRLIVTFGLVQGM